MSNRSGKQMLGRRYASALFDLAVQEKAVKAVESDLAAMVEMLEQSKDLYAAVTSPVVSRDELASLIAALAKKAGFSPLFSQFCATLNDNRRLAVLPEVYQAYALLAAEGRGEVQAEVTTARPLSASAKKELAAVLGNAVGKKITIATAVNPEILGGMIVKVGSQMMDDSVSTKLDRLGQHLKTSTM